MRSTSDKQAGNYYFPSIMGQILLCFSLSSKTILHLQPPHRSTLFNPFLSHSNGSDNAQRGTCLSQLVLSSAAAAVVGKVFSVSVNIDVTISSFNHAQFSMETIIELLFPLHFFLLFFWPDRSSVNFQLFLPHQMMKQSLELLQAMLIKPAKKRDCPFFHRKMFN